MNEKITELPLQGKYLKYSPEITFDIFKLVCDRLISLGYRSYDSMSIEYKYDEFKGKYPYFRENYYAPLEFNCYAETRGFKETTVKEILGDDPFIKETTIAKEWNKVTEEELLQEAKRRYPIGCKIKLIRSNLGGDFKNEVRFTKYKFFGNSKGKQLFIDGNLLLFHEGVWAEIESLPEAKTKEVIPEYIECIKPQSDYFIPGNIYKVLDTEYIDSCKIISNIKCSHYEADNILWVSLANTSYYKPSTKEAFEAQIILKNIGRWSVGTYGVIINASNTFRYKSFKIGFIDKVESSNSDGTRVIFEKFMNYKPYDLAYSDGVEFKWFATKREAEEFAKTLVTPIKEEVKQAVHCKTKEEWNFVKNKVNRDNDWEEDYPCQILVGKTPWKGGVQFCIDEGIQILSFEEWCNLNGYKMETKQPLQQAVYCKTIEEYKFTKEKLGAIFYKGAFFEKGSVIRLDNIGCTISLDRFSSRYSHYKLLSFQEWCDLNGYKMKVEQPLKQVVQCTTHEEWEFVISKLSSNSKLSRQRNKFERFIKENPNGIAINTMEDLWSDIDYWKEEGYQILSFQEWCGLNEYKMESKQPLKQMDKSKIFEVGDYVVITKSNINWTREMDSEIGKVVKITNIDSDGYIDYRGKPHWSFGVYDNHFRHATQEEIKNLKTESIDILDESCIGKFISFNCGKCFYDEALIIKENGYIYLLNNCYSNNNEHINKSIYKYSLKFSNLAEVESICTDIKLLNTEEVLESQYQKSVQPDGLRLKTKNSHITIDYIKIEPKEKTKLREFKFNYLPEPE